MPPSVGRTGYNGSRPPHSESVGRLSLRYSTTLSVLGREPAGGRGVDQHQGVVVALHDGGRPLGAHLALHELGNGLGLALSGGDEDELAGLHDGGQPLGDAVGGDRIDVAVEEAGVVSAGLLVELANVRARVEGATGLVESDVPVGADAEDRSEGRRRATGGL